MALKKRVTKVYLLPNGNFTVFNTEGQQIGELQGPYSIDLHKRILLEAMDDCEFDGFSILPSGFIKHAKDYADYYRGLDMSWEEIQNL